MQIQKKINKGASFITLMLLTGLVVSGLVSAQSAPAPPPPGSNSGQRLEQRKRERAIQLNDKDQKRLSQQCVSTQGVIRELQRSTGTIVTNHTKTYQKIDAKLWVTIGRLKLSDKDTFELEKRRGQLAEKAANFQTIAGYYQQTLDDMVVINCQADLVGFKALIDTARTYYEQTRASSADVRNYVVDQIKPILAGFATELQPKSTTEGDR